MWFKLHGTKTEFVCKFCKYHCYVSKIIVGARGTFHNYFKDLLIINLWTDNKWFLTR